jgi:Protein of unknown function (DUF4235)
VQDPVGRRCYVLDVNLRRVPDTTGRRRMWSLVSTSIGVAGGVVAKKLLRSAYQAVRKQSPDTAFDPTSARFSWLDALLWSIAAGIGFVIAKMLGDRLAAIGWEVATGTLPPVGEEQASA